MSYSEDMGMPGEKLKFSLEPILLDLDSGNYAGPPCRVLWKIWSMGNVKLAASEEAEAEEAAVTVMEVVMEPVKERVEVRVIAETVQGAGDMEVTKGCGCTMRCTCPLCPFRTGKTFTPFCRGRSYPHSTATFFSRTGTCA